MEFKVIFALGRSGLVLGVAAACLLEGFACSSDESVVSPTTGGSAGSVDGGTLEASPEASGGMGGTAGTTASGGSAGIGGCSKESDAGLVGTGGYTNCTKVSATPFTAGGYEATIQATLQPNLGDAPKDLLELGLHKICEELQPGDFDLSKETDLALCEHCVRAVKDNFVEFFQVEGTLKLEQIADRKAGKFKGSMHNVTLVQVQIDADLHAKAVPGGECLILEDVSFDTVAAVGCTKQEDCGIVDLYVCDPKSRSCVTYQCDPLNPVADPSCSGSDYCFAESWSELGYRPEGACFVSCTPFVTDTGCGPNQDCVITRPIFSDKGMCLDRGTTPVDTKCDPQSAQLSTGCAAGARCVNEAADSSEFTPLCRATCDYWNSPSCGNGQLCSVRGFCTALPQENVALGEDCTASVTKLWAFCAPKDGRYEGYCADLGDKRQCKKLCRSGVPSDCPASTSCTLPIEGIVQWPGMDVFLCE